MSKEYTIPVLKPGWPKVIGDLRVAQTNLYYPHVGDKLVGEQIYAFPTNKKEFRSLQEGEDLVIFY